MAIGTLIGQDGGPFAFISGLFALLGSGTSAFIESEKQEAENKRYLDAGYNMLIQTNRYSCVEDVMDEYSLEDTRKAINAEYPNMSALNIYIVAEMAMCKHKMERDTHFMYYVPDPYSSLGDISRFAVKKEMR